MRLSELFTSNSLVFTKNKADFDVNVNKGERNYAENYLVSSFNAIRGCTDLLELIFEKK